MEAGCEDCVGDVVTEEDVENEAELGPGERGGIAVDLSAGD